MSTSVSEISISNMHVVQFLINLNLLGLSLSLCVLAKSKSKSKSICIIKQKRSATGEGNGIGRGGGGGGNPTSLLCKIVKGNYHYLFWNMYIKPRRVMSLKESIPS